VDTATSSAIASAVMFQKSPSRVEGAALMVLAPQASTAMSLSSASTVFTLVRSQFRVTDARQMMIAN